MILKENINVQDVDLNGMIKIQKNKGETSKWTNHLLNK